MLQRAAAQSQSILSTIMMDASGCQTAPQPPMSVSPTNTIQIILNGEPRQVPEELSVADLLVHIGIVADRVAVELNRDIVRKTEWPTQTVPDGAHVEVVQFVGGG